MGDVGGSRYPLPAKVFIRHPEYKLQCIDSEKVENLYGWYDAAVFNYNDLTGRWTVVTLDGLKRTFVLPRIHIYFFAEDPRIFARRIATALEERRRAEACVR